jgi:ABC-type Fe3+/spermidine/putrescine transport system ATPase subunit
MLPATDLKAKKEKTEQILTQLNMLHMADKRVADLSGGEKQRVAIARAIITRPQVLLLDEPFNQVDTSFREGLQQDIRQIVKELGITVIMVSHDPAEVLSMADELVVIKNGQIVEQGHPKTLYQHPQHLYTAQLLSNCNVLSAANAQICGIETIKDHVVIYPDWIRIKLISSTKSWAIKQILFRGFYEDLIIEKEGVQLRVSNGEPDSYKEGDMVSVRFWKWLEY